MIDDIDMTTLAPNVITKLAFRGHTSSLHVNPWSWEKSGLETGDGSVGQGSLVACCKLQVDDGIWVYTLVFRIWTRYQRELAQAKLSSLDVRGSHVCRCVDKGRLTLSMSRLHSALPKCQEAKSRGQVS
jgi:hypothetical protein